MPRFVAACQVCCVCVCGAGTGSGSGSRAILVFQSRRVQSNGIVQGIDNQVCVQEEERIFLYSASSSRVLYTIMITLHTPDIGSNANTHSS
jgi:hypothetical protein